MRWLLRLQASAVQALAWLVLGAATAVAAGAGRSAYAQPAPIAGERAVPTVGLLVELASGVPRVQSLQHLPPGSEIVLGRGRLVLSSTDGCRRYTLDGGRATIRETTVEAVGGRIEIEEHPRCRPLHAATGSGVNFGARADAAFPAAVWRDRVVRGPAPLFTWAGAGADVSVTAVDVMPPQVIWHGRGVAGWLEYAGPPLIRGARYLVTATTTDGRSVGALFLVDPEQDRLPVLAARLVPVTDPALTLGAVVPIIRPLSP